MSDLAAYAIAIGYFVCAAFFGGLYHNLFGLECDSNGGWWMGCLWPVVTVTLVGFAIIGGIAFCAVTAGNWIGTRIARVIG
jgi:hypothetical protein